MEITILCTDAHHPVFPRLGEWAHETVLKGHSVSLVTDKRSLRGGDILFLVSCSQFVNERERDRFKVTLVLHASDLPGGRGWSPHIWSILNGDDQITVTLLEAKDPVDSGPIYLQTKFTLEGHELLPEINAKLFDAEMSLMSQAVEQFEHLKPTPQVGDCGRYMPRRSPADSRLDPNKTIAEQFNLLRIVDSERYPAFFDHRGKRYLIKIEKGVSDEP
jgi:methionyl-tRNA formyltransferase